MWAPSGVLNNHWFLPNTMAWDRACEHGRRSPTTPQRERERERDIGLIVIMWHLASCTTHITRHHLFIKLKFIRNVCSFCGTLAEQDAHNPIGYGWLAFIGDFGFLQRQVLLEMSSPMTLERKHESEGCWPFLSWGKGEWEGQTEGGVNSWGKHTEASEKSSPFFLRI